MYNRLERKTKSGRHQLSLYDELKDFLDEVEESVWESKEQALDKAADYFLVKVAAVTPTRTGRTRDSWVRTDKYYNVRYIYNTALTPQRIPVANIIEFKEGFTPFIRPCFEKNKQEIIDIIVKGVKAQ
jgi:hypothetical protein